MVELSGEMIERGNGETSLGWVVREGFPGALTSETPKINKTDAHKTQGTEKTLR